jgi:regulator of sigma E protease
MILAAQLLLSLSILIILHEFGHYLPAKLFKTRVEKFYLFFDPWFSLIKKKIGETTYGIGWLPLGGYVKISGMVDESMDKEQMAKPAEPWEFRAKPAWQRLIIMVGGVFVNIIVGIVIYSLVMWNWGEVVLPTERASYGVHCNKIMYQYGFRDGDKILALDGVAPIDFSDINKSMLLDDPKVITVDRQGQKLDLTLPDDFGQLLVDSAVKSGAFGLRFPSVIDSLLPDYPAKKAGLMPGDSIVGVNNLYSAFHQDLQREIKKHPLKTIRLHFVRNDSTMAVDVPVNKEGGIGFYPKTPDTYFQYDTLHYSFGAAFPAGAHKAWETVTDYSSQLRFLFSKSGAKEVGSFITFAKLFSPEWDWWEFWLRTAFISLILAFMNILPIPALDGGHVMFLLWEMFTGKAVSQNVLEKAQMVGMFLLLGLMVYGLSMDLFRASGVL